MDLRVKCDLVGEEPGASPALLDHVRRRVLFVLMHRRSRIAGVDVRVAPLRSKRLTDAPPGHSCRVEVELVDGERIGHFEIGAADVHATADRAIDVVGARVEAHLHAAETLIATD
jgi:hypothetical protein